MSITFDVREGLRFHIAAVKSIDVKQCLILSHKKLNLCFDK